MLRYVVSNLGPETSQANQDKLVSALQSIKGIKDVALVPARKEITFGISGPEPKVKVLKEVCQQAGFTLGNRL